MIDLRAKAKELNLFDANCFFGPVSRPQPESFETPADLLAEMDRLGIAEALAYHADARWHSPAQGNELLLRETAGQPRLHACWVLLPPEARALAEPGRLVEEMIGRGVRAARMFAREHRFVISEWCVGALARALEEARMPLFLDFDRRHWAEDVVPWDQVAALCEAHPRLPVVLVHESFGSLNYLCALMARHQNLMIETSYFVAHDGIQEICTRYGPERLLFGTAMPTYEGGGPIGNLTLSGVSEETRRCVAGDNLRRLLEGVGR